MNENIVTIDIEEGVATIQNDSPQPFHINQELLKAYYQNRLDSYGLKRLGKSIYDALFCTEFRKSLLSTDGDTTTLLLIRSNNPSIHNIPFELLNHNPNLDDAVGYLLKSGVIHLLRSVKDKDMPITPINRPLKMLMILSQPLEVMEHSPIDPLREVTRLRQAIQSYLDHGTIELVIEERPTLQRLRNRITEGYDIIHYSGHGSENGTLILESSDDERRAYSATAEELSEVFRIKPPRLIYLDSCEGARSGNGISPSLAMQLYTLLPNTAVVANTASIGDKSATESVSLFYQMINQGDLGKALNTIRTAPNLLEWYKSVGFLPPHRQLFDFSAMTPSPRPTRILEYHFEPTRHYIYRYRLVRRVSDLMERANHLLLHGLGGAGKSTLALYLCSFHEARFDHILFFDLKEDEIDTPEYLLNELEALFGIDSASHQSLLQRVQEIGKLGRTLLVLDNLEEIAQEASGKLKKEWKKLIDTLLKQSNIFTIFTSRLKIYRGRDPLANTLTIGTYEMADILLLAQQLSDEKREFLGQHFAEFQERYGLHPLALSRFLELKSLKAVAYDEELNDILSFYAEIFKQKPLLSALIHLPLPLSRTTIKEKFPELIADIERLQLAEVKDNSYHFYPILRLIAHQDASVEINRELYNRLQDSTHFNDQFNRLMVTPNDLLIDEMIKVLDHNPPLEPFVKYFDLEKLFQLAKNYESTPKRQAKVQNNLGNFYSDLRKYDKAEKLYTDSLKIREKLAQENPAYLGNLAGIQNNLGNFYSDLRKYDKAEKFYIDSLKIFEKLVQENPAYIGSLAEIQNNLGVFYKSLGKDNEAEKLYIDSLENYKKLAQENPAYLDNLAKVQNNLGNFYKNLGEYDKAEKLYIDSLKNYKKLAQENPTYLGDLAQIQNNLGNFYSDLRKYDKAEKFYIDSLKIREKLAQENPAYLGDLAQIQNNLGNFYRNLGEDKKAKQFFIDALENYKKHAQNNPTEIDGLAQTQNNLGALYSDFGEYDKAEKLYTDALENYKKLAQENLAYLGNLAGIQNNLGAFYSSLGKFDKAKIFYIDALENYKKLTQENSAYLGDLAVIQNNLGIFYSNLKEYKKSKELLKASLQIYQQLSQTNKKYIKNEFRTWLYWSVASTKIGAWKEIIATIDRYYEILDYLAIDEKILEHSWLKEQVPLPPDPESLLQQIPYPTIRQRFKEALSYISEYYQSHEESL